MAANPLYDAYTGAQRNLSDRQMNEPQIAEAVQHAADALREVERQCDLFKAHEIIGNSRRTIETQERLIESLNAAPG